MAQANLTEALIRGARSEFLDTYKTMIAQSNPLLKNCMTLGLPSDKLSEVYPYFESAPNPRRWVRGEEIPREALTTKSFLVPNYKFGLAVDWFADDEADDQTGGFMGRVREVAERFALLPERIFFQYLTAGVDADLMPVVPNAADGVALFSATNAGGGNRFGVAGGNIVTGSGVATTAAIQTDFYAAMTRFIRFLDTTNQPLWPAELVSRGVTIIYGAANEQVFQQAFLQNFVQGTAAAPSNVILNAGHKVTLWSTPRITDNDWFVFLNAPQKKPVFEQVREPLTDNIEDMLNSDLSRRTDNRSIQWKARMGYGIQVPYGCIKVNN